jgi:hypothetical protein
MNPDRQLMIRKMQLTKGDAVGPSRIASSSLVNGNLGTMKMRRGRRSMMTTGNPIAADTVSEVTA